MKRKSWRRTERDGIKPVPDNLVPYRDWCEQSGLNPESVEAWEKWAKKYRIEEYLP